MTYLIDAHEDLSYNILTFNRDYLRSVAETRRLEAPTQVPEHTGHTLIGWPEYQRGQVAVVFATLFAARKRANQPEWDTLSYTDLDQAGQLLRDQVDLYRRLTDNHPEQFRMIYDLKDLDSVLAPWDRSPADYPDHTHPVGLVILMEGAEGIRIEELDEWWERGVRIIGPVWAGGRFCGGSYAPGGFTGEGLELLENMAGLGFTLDIAHMTDLSAQQALDAYEGPVIASHANARALLKGMEGERHLTDTAIRLLIERDGVMGVLPFNAFLKAGWRPTDDPGLITLETVAAHIDHICQLAGDARHVGIGSDFDGGFGREAVPAGVDSVADLKKLGPLLSRRGYSSEDVELILHGNWQRHLERTLPHT